MSPHEPPTTPEARGTGRSAAPAQPVVSFLIVSFNTRDMTLGCIDSVLRETRALPFEVIVVDNASSDGSADAIRASFPSVRLLAPQENLGFGRGTNLAAEHAVGEYLVLLNPDTVLLGDTAHTLVEFLRARPGAGACGGRTYFGDRTLDPTSCWRRITPWSALTRALGLSTVFPRSRLFDPEAIPGWERDTARTVDMITGCLLAIERSFWTELGGFDPQFFMYGEDQDLCIRIQEAGRTCWICPEAEIIHFGGASETVRADKVVRLCKANALLFQKHWSPRAARFGIWTLGLHAWTRMAGMFLASRVARGKVETFRTWRAVWRRRGEWRAVRPATGPSARVTPSGAA